MRQLVIVILILIFGNTELYSQTVTADQIEKDLRNSYLKIDYHRTITDSIGSDSVEFANKLLIEKLCRYTSRFPFTMTYSFTSLKKANMIITDSGDKLLRVYSWDTGRGGTMADYGNVFQYKSGDKIYSKVYYDTIIIGEGEYVPFYSQIFTMHANNKTYYLAINNGKYSTSDVSQSIKIFTIENSSLNDKVKLIKTQSGFVNSIDVNFDFFSVVDRPERPLRLIRYDSTKKIIYIPIVYKNGKVTNKFIQYKFTGQYFERLKT